MTCWGLVIKWVGGGGGAQNGRGAKHVQLPLKRGGGGVAMLKGVCGTDCFEVVLTRNTWSFSHADGGGGGRGAGEV